MNARDPIRIGVTGRTTSPLCPGGKIEIEGRLLDARSAGPPIEAGRDVVVSAGDAFRLVVIPLEPGRDVSTLKNFGKPVQQAPEPSQHASTSEERTTGEIVAEDAVTLVTLFASTAAFWFPIVVLVLVLVWSLVK